MPFHTFDICAVLQKDVADEVENGLGQIGLRAAGVEYRANELVDYLGGPYFVCIVAA